MEAGVLLDKKGEALYWHLPNNRSGGALPDSVDLWSVIWENRDNISGFAHSHPGFGLPQPSWTDITTFNSIENGLAKRINWFITSKNRLIVCTYKNDGIYTSKEVDGGKYGWVSELRNLSNYDAQINNEGIYIKGK